MKGLRGGLWPSLLVLALLPALIGLGCWQLHRAEQKRQLLAQYAERQSEAPRNVEQLAQLADPAFVRVRLHGQLDAAHSVLLDNRLRGGEAGVELLQPLQDLRSGLWLWVNRGWLAWPDRRVPVHFDTPAQPLTLDGQVYVAPGAAFQLHADSLEQPWPQLLTALNASALWQRLERPGYAHEVRLQAGPAAYQVDWPLLPMGPEKHLGYAVQWFALATTLTLLYLYLLWRTYKEHGHGRHPGSRRA